MTCFELSTVSLLELPQFRWEDVLLTFHTVSPDWIHLSEDDYDTYDQA